MKSVAIKEKRLLEIKEIDSPVSDGENVIIDVLKTGICGSDIHYFEEGTPVGLVMGHEFCGKVVDTGSRTDLKVGDRVTALPISPCNRCEACLSGNHQYCLETWNNASGLSLTSPGGFAKTMKVRSDMVYKVPDNVSSEEAAMVEPAAVSLHAIHLADIKVGSKVLVVGGGIIGLTAAYFAKMEGASFVALSETNEKRGKKAVTLGVADEYIDALNPNFVADIMAKTNGGFDFVIDCCGNSSAVSSALLSTKVGGTLVLVGVSLTPITIPTVVAVMHELKVLGAIAYTKNEFKTILDLLENKQINLKQFVDKVVSLSEVQESFLELTSGSSETIKILVDPNK